MAVQLDVLRVSYRAGDATERLKTLRRRLSLRGDVVSESGRQRTIDVFGEPLTPAEVVGRICSDVSQHGLDAVLSYTRRLDGAELTPATLRVGPEEFAEAHRRADDGFLQAVRRTRKRILSFQSGILHRDAILPVQGRYELRQRYRPLRRAGLLIPGGAAAYPSTLLMTAVPAQAAGVRELAVVAPPTPFGAYNDDLLAVCYELGIGEVYRVGGAQAVAALAYGVDGMPRVDKIVGPGNLFVQLAKKHVFGDVDIDMLAGPSEVVILADASARPGWIAADLIAQAEHDPGVSILISWSEEVVDAVAEALEVQLDLLPRGELARRSLEEFGALILVSNEDEAVELANQFAAEHLELATADPERLVDRIEQAGAIFLGHDSPVALGDYVAGPSHVLPTSGTARFASGLCANDFLRRSSILSFTSAGIDEVADDLRLIAEKEQLTAHARSVEARVTNSQWQLTKEDRMTKSQRSRGDT